MSFPKVKCEPNDGGRGAVDQGVSSRGGPVVHVRGDSETELDLLFSVLKNDSKQPGQTFRDKNLPPSFFNPPEPKPGGGSHSRDGSLDQGGQLQTGPGGLIVYHGRSHSSPAQLPVSLSLPNGPGLHLKQGSADLGVDNPNSKFFLNNPANPWQEPCKSHDATSGTAGAVLQNKQPSHNGMVNQSNAGLLQQTILDNSQALGTLPQGWEQGVTAEGDIYFINHNDKSTSWYDPRIPKHLQKPGALKGGGNQQTQPSQQALRPPGNLSQPHNSLPPSIPSMGKQQVQHVIHPGHIPKQNFLSQQQQLPNQLHVKQPLSSAAQLRASPSVLSQINQTQQQQPLRTDQIRIELQKLHKERERLLREQDENARKEQMLLNELLNQENLKAMVPNNLIVAQAMQQQMNISGVDPFLGQTVMGPDVHARQNSGDSGLGSCYSLPRTPEDFLGNIDALDRHDIANMQKKQQQQQHLAQQQQQQQQQLCDFGMNPRQNSLGGLDMSALGDSSTEPMPMDSDELVSTLTDDLGLGRDFLEIQMMDILL